MHTKSIPKRTAGDAARHVVTQTWSRRGSLCLGWHSSRSWEACRHSRRFISLAKRKAFSFRVSLTLLLFLFCFVLFSDVSVDLQHRSAPEVLGGVRTFPRARSRGAADPGAIGSAHNQANVYPVLITGEYRDHFRCSFFLSFLHPSTSSILPLLLFFLPSTLPISPPSILPLSPFPFLLFFHSPHFASFYSSTLLSFLPFFLPNVRSTSLIPAEFPSAAIPVLIP